ncbi:MAG: DUF1036 domain-containing protein [Alphaproteobacteria bacterium]|nr:DUF1036 domain-containing protein [Alphaproteobacteria bacterium]
MRSLLIPHTVFLRIGFAVFSAGLLLGAPSAEAALSFCNRTDGTIEAALGYRSDADKKNGSWTAEGWWRIEPGQCARVYSKPLSQRFYFYYAHTLPLSSPDAKTFSWTGKYIFCTDNKAFHIEGDGNCASRGYKATGFQELDIGSDAKNYTLDFKSTQAR